MNIKNVPIEQVIPYINNPRHNESAIDKVASSIAEFGFKVPAIIDKNNVLVTGHTRVLAAKKLGLKEIPCIVADDLTDAQIKAFRIADNKVSEYATWDEEALRIDLEQLQEMDFDLEDVSISLEDFNMQPRYEDDTLPDELELERTERTGERVSHLRFATYDIILSEHEEKGLTDLVENYVDRTGVIQGFVSELLRRLEV